MFFSFKNHPSLKYMLLAPLNILYRLNNKWGVCAVHLLKTHKIAHIKHPQTFNEKIQWLKLYYRNHLYPLCADKYAVRQYVKQQGCEMLLNRLYWQGEKAEDIPLGKLPQQFVAKVTHGCGYNIFCFNKENLDWPGVVRQLNKWKHQQYLECYGEWFYGVVPPRIIIEEFTEGDLSASFPADYKVHCFNGRPKLVQLDVHRFNKQHFRNIYDLEWNLLNYSISIPNNRQYVHPKPQLLPQMLEYAAKLAAPFPYARIDFYLKGNQKGKQKLVFGEITLTHGAGFIITKPDSLNKIMGGWITLPAPQNPYRSKVPV